MLATLVSAFLILQGPAAQTPAQTEGPSAVDLVSKMLSHYADAKTASGKIIILVVEGRNPGIAEGASLPQEAQMLKDIGCVEALNLDGGGSSCMLVNGKPTIKVSDKEGQRPVPAVFISRRSDR